jgi:hypothetical protein
MKRRFHGQNSEKDLAWRSLAHCVKGNVTHGVFLAGISLHSFEQMKQDFSAPHAPEYLNRLAWGTGLSPPKYDGCDAGESRQSLVILGS